MAIVDLEEARDRLEQLTLRFIPRHLHDEPEVRNEPLDAVAIKRLKERCLVSLEGTLHKQQAILTKPAHDHVELHFDARLLCLLLHQLPLLVRQLFFAALELRHVCITGSLLSGRLLHNLLLLSADALGLRALDSRRMLRVVRHGFAFGPLLILSRLERLIVTFLLLAVSLTLNLLVVSSRLDVLPLARRVNSLLHNGRSD